MKKSFWAIILVSLIVVPFAINGCKGKVDKTQAEYPTTESEAMISGTSTTNISDNLVVTEPAQSVATETIPPTAAPEIAVKPTAPAAVQQTASRAKDIQRALKNAGFYSGSVDGKIGPKTKKAIEEFQTAKGLKADGKVGPRTWVELEKYLTQ